MVFVTLAETLDTAGGVNQLLLSREERVATGADFHVNVAFVGRTGLEGTPAGAVHGDDVVGGMDFGFHQIVL